MMKVLLAESVVNYSREHSEIRENVTPCPPSRNSGTNPSCANIGQITLSREPYLRTNSLINERCARLECYIVLLCKPNRFLVLGPSGPLVQV